MQQQPPDSTNQLYKSLDELIQEASRVDLRPLRALLCRLSALAPEYQVMIERLETLMTGINVLSQQGSSSPSPARVPSIPQQQPTREPIPSPFLPTLQIPPTETQEQEAERQRIEAEEMKALKAQHRLGR